jgi:hypothetical protein
MELDDDGRIARPLLSTELIDPESGEVEQGPELPATMYDHHAWRLPDGTIALIGGKIGSEQFVGLKYDPATNKVLEWVPEGINYYWNEVSEFGVLEDGRSVALARRTLLVFDADTDEAGLQVSLPTSIASMEVSANTVWGAGYNQSNGTVELLRWDGDAGVDAVFVPIAEQPFAPEAPEFGVTLSGTGAGFVVSVGSEGIFYYDRSGEEWEAIEGVFTELRDAHTVGDRVFFDGLPSPRALSPTRAWEQPLPTPTARRAHATVIDGFAVHRVGGVDSTDWSEATLVDLVESCP